MKVLYLIESLGGGGTERSLAELVLGLAPRGLEATIVHFRQRPGVGDELAAAGVDVRCIGWSGHRRAVAAVRAIQRELCPDLVHTMLVRADLVGRFAGFGAVSPVLSSLVSVSYAPERVRDPALPRRRVRLLRLLDALSARWLCDHLHAVSETVADHAVRYLGVPRMKITVIRRGRDPARLGRASRERRAACRAELGLDDASVVLLAAGRHEYAKGLDTLLQAMTPVAQRLPEATLLVAGREGSATERLRALLAERGLAERVRLLGHRRDLPDLLAAADLFVFPSRYEGMPGAVLEAMALGLPIVASDIPAVREVVEPGANALLVPADDAAALAERVLDLAAAPETRTRFGRRSREIFEQQFTLERSLEAQLQLYERLIGVRG